MSKFAKTLCVLLVLAALGSIVYLFIAAVGNTTNDLYYENASSIQDYRLGYPSHEYPEGSMCQFPGCSAHADRALVTDGFFYDSKDDEVQKSMDKLLSALPNKAGFSVKANGFTYVDTDKGLSVDRGTYLVPQGDGSWKVEKRTTYRETTIYGSEKYTAYVFLDGAYCNEHTDEARTILKGELEDFFLNSFGHWASKNVVWATAVIGLLTIVLIVIVANVDEAIRSKKEKKQTA